MKPQPAGPLARPRGSGPSAAARSLQEELVAAIHGAFEVAVQIVVKEVKRLVVQTAEDRNKCEELRRENSLLRERLQRAEALLHRREAGGGQARSPPLPGAAEPPDPLLRSAYGGVSPEPGAGEVCGRRGAGADAPPPPPPPAPPPEEHVSGQEERRARGEARTPRTGAAAHPEDEAVNARVKEVTEISPLCVVKVESTNQPCEDSTAQCHNSAPTPSTDEKSTLEQVIVKEEATEEEGRDASACCLDSIKVEDFSLECMSAVQSKMLEEWESQGADTLSEDANTQLSCTGLTQGHHPHMTTGLPPPPDLPSLSSEFPIFQLAEPAPIPEASQQVYGVHMRGGHNLGHTINVYTCKSCGQTFHLPSLLRRHHSQCPQKLQQCCQQPVAGGKKSRVQLYPPGCSPFRCTECNREFNRMENLKTHLRIHTGERPYTCSVCSKCFRHSGALTRHFRIHTGEKPYVCGQCGKSFRNCGGLKFHQRSHREQLK